MNRQFRHILVAVGDVQRPPKNELCKAAALARSSGASVELFHAIDEPDPFRSYPETATSEAVKKQRAAIVAKSEAKLRRLASDASLRGIKVTLTAAWDHPSYDAIVRRAQATHADLVIAAAHGHRLGARLMLRNTDWELIRHCPVPLLLVKSRRMYHKPVVLAAVDPFHAHAKPADLDARLLDAANEFAQLLHGTTHIFHAYMPLIAIQPAMVSSASVMALPPEIEEVHGRQIARAIDDLAARAGIPRRRCHIHMGDVPGEMCAQSRRMRADIVVMGVVSRSALARLFIGNTAERVLDKLNCDVLVVKPRSLAANATRRSMRQAGRSRRAVAPASASRSELEPVPPLL